MDNKVAVIYGNEYIDKNIYEGNIEKIGDINSDDIHLSLLYKFTEEKYPNNEVYEKISLDYHAEPSVIAYFHTEYLNNIVILNLTQNNSHFIKNYGYQALVFMPDETTKKQKETLYKLIDKMKEYDITILYDFYYENGKLKCNDLKSKDREKTRELFDRYFKKNQKGKVM